MAKLSNKDILNRIKKKQAEEAKANITFRMNIALMDKFRERCIELEMPMAVILEELILEFIK